MLRLSIRRPVGRKPTCPVDSPSRLRESTPERVSTITGRSRAGARSVVDRHVTSQVAPFVSISSHCVEPAQIDRTSPLPSPPQPTLDSTIQFNRVVSTLIQFNCRYLFFHLFFGDLFFFCSTPSLPPPTTTTTTTTPRCVCVCSSVYECVGVC